MNKDARIGFIGLGIMGKPMARNLLKAGYELTVYDVNQAAVSELTQEGAQAGVSPADVAGRTDMAITMLPNSPHVRAVVQGENGLLAGASPGYLIVDMSSIAPLTSQELAAAAGEKGVVMLDAPVSGGEPKAVDGTLAIMVGGDAEAFERVRDILLIMGASAVHVGDSGSGNVAKLANQVMVAMNIAGMSEALTLAAKAGVDPEKVFDAVKGGLAGSTVLNAKVPMVLAGNFKPGFRLELHIKDLMNAVDTAHEIGVPIPLTAQVLGIMESLKAWGKSGDDHGGLIQYYETLAGIEVRRTKR